MVNGVSAYKGSICGDQSDSLEGCLRSADVLAIQHPMLVQRFIVWNDFLKLLPLGAWFRSGHDHGFDISISEIHFEPVVSNLRCEQTVTMQQ